MWACTCAQPHCGTKVYVRLSLVSQGHGESRAEYILTTLYASFKCEALQTLKDLNADSIWASCSMSTVAQVHHRKIRSLSANNWFHVIIHTEGTRFAWHAVDAVQQGQLAKLFWKLCQRQRQKNTNELQGVEAEKTQESITASVLVRKNLFVSKFDFRFKWDFSKTLLDKWSNVLTHRLQTQH